MYSILNLIGLCSNFVGALFMSFSFVWKEKKEKKGERTVGTIRFGKEKGFFKAGIVLLTVGFAIQVVALVLNMVVG